jgi:peptide deformylase
MALPIVQVGDPVLRKPARPLSPEEIRSGRIQELIVAMRDTMREAPGVGLAAPQIGESLQIAVIEDRPEYMQNAAPDHLAEQGRAPVAFHVLVNPLLYVVRADTAWFFEGCLSFSPFLGIVPRALEVHVDALDERGEPVSIDARGWYARILQHEIDHLGGVVCIDHMLTRTLSTSENFAKHWGRMTIDDVRRALGPSAPPPRPGRP